MNPILRWLRRGVQGMARRRLELEALEGRTLLSAGFYSSDGTGNNVADPSMGSAGTDLIRLSPAAYADGINKPSLPNATSARVISDLLNNQANPSSPSQDLNTLNGNHLTDFGYTW